MEIRHATNPLDFKSYDTSRLRNDFLIDSLFTRNETNYVYSHYDRLIVGGAFPVGEELALNDEGALKTKFFLERRELGIINIAGEGIVTVNGEEHTLQTRDCLYVGLGNEEVTFKSIDHENPAKFYLVSSPAHQSYPVQKLAIQESESTHLGTVEQSNVRTIYKYIHGNGIKSCQLMLGITLLEPGSMWNTMPAHVHDRRMEAYLYFDLSEDQRVMHFMGEPGETRHLIVKNEQAIISPPWSIHSGVGTGAYSFIWAMAGENYTFDDMDFVDMEDLK
ncbi:5-dehydro-4-deoxy-D-glucuronate isomerase [Jeotgalibacillus soli]|uniref:4-deoxy-L-threo-5-hexosulose-uronate ketol-isomerase n=1 Tax=Jeotgalibacillus soli TaxID=889306 RepID=A0A0C2VT68_9BACL|nr:5-dehydro-4-deoxy-D-glucuronate isomerase [Jeotgalibacillus soli]KIL52122.1 5-keto-4-deoxyuronate isomerase [Jeotgalibacillus soli]